MSIIAQQTKFNLSNKSKYFIEVTISAEQDEEFRMIQETSGTSVVPVANQSQADHGLFSTMMDGLLNIFTGKQLTTIKVNIPAHSEVPISIRCLTSLTFTTSIVSQNVSDVIPGDFVLGPEYHGEPCKIIWKALLGYGYNSKGDVAIGGCMPSKRDLAIDAEFLNKHGKRVRLESVPTSCKINFN